MSRAKKEKISARSHWTTIINRGIQNWIDDSRTKWRHLSAQETLQTISNVAQALADAARKDQRVKVIVEVEDQLSLPMLEAMLRASDLALMEILNRQEDAPFPDEAMGEHPDWE